MTYNQYIDHTNLKSDCTKKDIIQLCEEAKAYQFASVCVNPIWVPFCYDYLQDSDVKICTVIGFPLGATCTEVKVFEAKQAIKDGADELDMVINIGALKDGDDQKVLDDMLAVVQVSQGRCVKVILETCLLTDEEKKNACQLAVQAQVDFVKTSTGFSSFGATKEDVTLMKNIVQGHCLVKASGGIRCAQDMKTMIDAGASRIGTSAGVKIMQSFD